MAKRSPEPFMWLLFSAGGMVTALHLPILLLLFGLGFPLGWVAAHDHARLLAVLHNPLTRAGLCILCVLALFHWAYRFHYSVRDALRLKYRSRIITTASYTSAVLGSVASCYIVLSI
jgi:fumarate reductase subunit D